MDTFVFSSSIHYVFVGGTSKAGILRQNVSSGVFYSWSSYKDTTYPNLYPIGIKAVTFTTILMLMQGYYSSTTTYDIVLATISWTTSIKYQPILQGHTDQDWPARAVFVSGTKFLFGSDYAYIFKDPTTMNSFAYRQQVVFSSDTTESC